MHHDTIAQGWQMAYFQKSVPKIPEPKSFREPLNGEYRKFWRAFKWRIPVYFMTILNILRQFCIFYAHLV
jgi:hypothetical protein